MIAIVKITTSLSTHIVVRPPGGGVTAKLRQNHKKSCGYLVVSKLAVILQFENYNVVNTNKNFQFYSLGDCRC